MLAELKLLPAMIGMEMGWGGGHRVICGIRVYGLEWMGTLL